MSLENDRVLTPGRRVWMRGVGGGGIDHIKHHGGFRLCWAFRSLFPTYYTYAQQWRVW